MNAAATGLGCEVAVGLVGGPDDFERIRQGRANGPMAALWHTFTNRVQHDKDVPLLDLALAAAVERRQDWANRASVRALELARAPATSWIHADAGCMTLSGGHNTLELSLAIDWLWPILNRDRREALVQGLIAQAVENLTRCPEGVRDPGDGRGRLLLMRRLDKSDPHCLHPVFEQVNNWDIWFATGLYLAASLAERVFLKPDPSWPRLEWGHYHDTGYELDGPRVERWKTVAQERIETALASQLGPNGDYGEGVNYAGYAGEALVVALLAMLRIGKIARLPEGVLAWPLWARNQFVADLTSPAANFNDSTMAGRLAVPLFALVASQNADARVQDITLDAIGQGKAETAAALLLAFTPELARQTITLPGAAHYRHTGTVTWRTAQDGTGVFFSLKSGAHGGAHQHRDRNTFFLWAYGEPLIVDSGDGRYAAQMYGPNFFETAAHNCVLIDGRGQVGDNSRPLAGKIVEHRDEDGLSTLLADAGSCYEGVEQCRRRVAFIRPDLFIITDRVRGACAELTWLLHAFNGDGAARWEIEGRRAQLVRPGARLDVFLQEVPAGTVISAGTLDGKPGGTLRLAASVRGKAVTAVLVPSRADEPAPEVEWHADGAIGVRFRGQVRRIRGSEERVTCDSREFSV